MSASQTQAVNEESQAFTGQNRRRHPREPHQVAATIQPADGSADVDEAVLVCNLSLGGVGLLCDRRYGVATIWRITLGNGPLFLNARIRVMNCRPRHDGKFDVGCQFC